LLGKDFEEFNTDIDALLSEFLSRGNYART